ncbi:hypothetical protein BOO92_20010 [Vibrio navarrensis]|uniref:hypothetical protein n=1 Tax=Vibrio navarrensis TaxID=29495 RepID=UPI001865F441|nr:hypothetical protein [Vibrio navarrensis]MBE3658957.1 hypothetical protein [Vibrio navarrensis]
MNVRQIALGTLTLTLVFWGSHTLIPEWRRGPSFPVTHVDSQPLIRLSKEAALPSPVLQLKQLLAAEDGEPSVPWDSGSAAEGDKVSEPLTTLRTRLERLKSMPAY